MEMDLNISASPDEVVNNEGSWYLDSASNAVSGFTIALATVGLLGNIWTIFAAGKLDCNTSGTGFIKCLALADMSSAFCDGIVAPVIKLSGLPVLTLSRLICKSFNYISWVTTFAGKLPSSCIEVF